AAAARPRRSPPKGSGPKPRPRAGGDREGAGPTNPRRPPGRRSPRPSRNPLPRSAALNPPRRTARVALLVVLAAGVPARAADPAELFPPDTLLYAEVHKPAEVGPQVAAAVKGSVLDDGIPLVHDRKDKAKNLRD